jgi:hypothetical protein
MMLLYVHGRWRKERGMEEQAGEVNQISGASLIGSANTARAAGCFGKVPGAEPADKLSRGLWRVWRVWRRCLEVRFLSSPPPYQRCQWW